MSPISPELQSKIASWRQKTAEGTMTIEDYKEAVLFLRSGRMAAAQAASAAKSRAKKSSNVPAAEDLLGELENL